MCLVPQCQMDQSSRALLHYQHGPQFSLAATVVFLDHLTSQTKSLKLTTPATKPSLTNTSRPRPSRGHSSKQKKTDASKFSALPHPWISLPCNFRLLTFSRWSEPPCCFTTKGVYVYDGGRRSGAGRREIFPSSPLFDQLLSMISGLGIGLEGSL